MKYSLLSAIFLSVALARECSSLNGIISPDALYTEYFGHDSCYPIAIIDVRSEGSYAEGHIPRSVSMPFAPTSVWSVESEDGIMINFPPTEDLSTTLGSAGICNETQVVIIGDDSVHGMAIAARVALTLEYAGMAPSQAAIMWGGFNGWAEAGYDVETEPYEPHLQDYAGEIDNSFIVDMEFVVDHLYQPRTTLIIDAREPGAYNGSVLEPGTAQPGHIPDALSVPASLMFDENERFKDVSELKGIAQRKIKNVWGRGRGQVIVYCRTGVLASSWTWVLTRIVGWHGYQGADDVFLYDGSAQEWSLYQEMQLEPYEPPNCNRCEDD